MKHEVSAVTQHRPVAISELSLNYSPIEDRIVLVWRGPQDQGGAFWLTRPLLARLTPPLLACLREPRPLAVGDRPWPAHLWTTDLDAAQKPPALVHAVKVFSAVGGLRLDIDTGDASVRLRLPQAQLAPLLQHLKTLSSRAGWGWATVSAQPAANMSAPASPTLH